MGTFAGTIVSSTRLSMMTMYLDLHKKKGAPLGTPCKIGELAEPIRNYFSSFNAACTFASLKYQMLGSVISMQAWLRLSPYAFVVLILAQQEPFHSFR